MSPLSPVLPKLAPRFFATEFSQARDNRFPMPPAASKVWMSAAPRKRLAARLTSLTSAAPSETRRFSRVTLATSSMCVTTPSPTFTATFAVPVIAVFANPAPGIRPTASPARAPHPTSAPPIFAAPCATNAPAENPALARASPADNGGHHSVSNARTPRTAEMFPSQSPILFSRSLFRAHHS